MEQQQKLLWTILSVAILFLVILAACMFIFLPSGGNPSAEQPVAKTQEPIEWVKADIPHQSEQTIPVITEDNIVIKTIQPKEIKPIEPKIVIKTEQESKPQPKVEVREIPAKPAVQKTIPEQPKETQPAKTQSQTQTKQTVKQTTGSNTEYWIQLGAFSTKDAADNATAVMKEHNHKASIISGTSNGKTVYRVRTGPYRDKGQADKALGAIKKIKGYDSSYIMTVKK